MTIKRALISINVRWWNAEAAYALNLARSLIDKGLKVWLIVNPDSPVHKKAKQLEIPAITDILLDSVSPFQQRKNFKKLLALIDRLDIQLINAFKSGGAFLFSLARRFRPRLLYVRTRGEARPPKKNVFNRLLYGKQGCDGVVASGEQVGKWLEDLGASQPNLKVIHYGSPPLCPSGKDPALIKQSLNIPRRAKVLTLLGRSQKVKGHRPLLEAFSMLENESLHLLFLIKDPDEFPEELRELKEFIKERDLERGTTILGFQKNLADILSVTDIGVIPSLASEVNCRAAVEFFSLGIPALTFPTGTLPDIVRHEKNGYLCSEKTAEDLAKGIRRMTAAPIALKKMGDAARADYLGKYTLGKLAEASLDFFESLSGSA